LDRPLAPASLVVNAVTVTCSATCWHDTWRPICAKLVYGRSAGQ
jgi:hypothetical protein